MRACVCARVCTGTKAYRGHAAEASGHPGLIESEVRAAGSLQEAVGQGLGCMHLHASAHASRQPSPLTWVGVHVPPVRVTEISEGQREVGIARGAEAAA